MVCVHVLSSLCYCTVFGGAHKRILEVAQNFEERGNEYFRGRSSCKEALGFYTQGADAKPNEVRLKELFLNCVACNFELRAPFLALSSPFSQVNLF